MLITSHCPACQTEYELSKKLLGDAIPCQKCGQSFTVTETEQKEARSIGLHSTFADRETPGDEPDSPAGSKMRFRDGKISLVLPPPPRELWSNVKDKDGPPPRFQEFRHKSKVVKNFLERDDVADYSWLLVAGLMISTLLVLAFLGFLIYLMIK